LGHVQPLVSGFSLAFPFAQKTLPEKFDLLWVGQLGHKQSLLFSSLSGTRLPKNSPIKQRVSLKLITICDCCESTQEVKGRAAKGLVS